MGSVALLDPARPATETVEPADLRDYFVGSFVRTLALLTWWLGGVLGGYLMWRRGGALDVPWGFVAGAFAGLAGAATFASVFLVVEAVPHLLWHAMTGDSGGAAGWLGWVVLALTWWLLLASTAGVACAALPPLRRRAAGRRAAGAGGFLVYASLNRPTLQGMRAAGTDPAARSALHCWRSPSKDG